VTYCLDSWAVLALLRDEQPAASKVERAMEEHPVMSWINAGEVFYVLARSAGEGAARQAVRDLSRTVTLEVPDEQRVIEAASIKAGHRLAYADAFAVATALAHSATLLTGDPEILAASATWPVRDLRS
jgi:predicted nucleic acid-binding protein